MTYALDDKDKIKNRCAELLAEHGIVSEQTVTVVCNINGYSLETLNDILYVTTGERDVIDFFARELEAEGLVNTEDEDEQEE